METCKEVESLLVSFLKNIDISKYSIEDFDILNSDTQLLENQIKIVELINKEDGSGEDVYKKLQESQAHKEDNFKEIVGYHLNDGKSVSDVCKMFKIDFSIKLNKDFLKREHKDKMDKRKELKKKTDHKSLHEYLNVVEDLIKCIPEI